MLGSPHCISVSIICIDKVGLLVGANCMGAVRSIRNKHGVVWYGILAGNYNESISSFCAEGVRKTGQASCRTMGRPYQILHGGSVSHLAHMYISGQSRGTGEIAAYYGGMFVVDSVIALSAKVVLSIGA